MSWDSRDHEKPLTAQHLDLLVAIASEMGFEPISYDDLAGWRAGSVSLPERPVMFDFDHPVKSVRHDVREVLDRYGFKGNLFIYTRPYEKDYGLQLPWDVEYEHMTWEKIRELREAGWHIGAHTVSHPNRSDLSVDDPLERCSARSSTAAMRLSAGIWVLLLAISLSRAQVGAVWPSRK